MIVDAPVERAAALLTERLGPRAQRDVPLGPMTTYRVGGVAALFVEITALDELAAVAEVRAVTDVPVLVVGRGSNMLVADDGFDGLAISIASLADSIELPTHSGDVGERCEVRAGGGVSLPVLARRTASVGVRGFEWAVGVPGSVGGAVRMNAGGHGSDMAACLVDVDVFDLATAATRTLAAPEIGLRFRASSLDPAHIVVGVRLALRYGDRAEAEAEIADIVRWRREHQPGGQNCGSVFVNPVPGKLAAGELVDSLGLRGFRIGSAWVSEKHANFIQVGEDGRAGDVRAVIEAVRHRVREETGYALRSEVRLVGFGDADPLSFDDLAAGS